jgi:hypothetical protein
VVISESTARRDANFRVYERMLAAQNAKDRDAFLACFADDIVFEAPYYRPDAPIASGKAALGSMFDAMSEKFSSLDYRIKRFIPAVDPDLVIAEVAGDNAVVGTGLRYQNDYLFLIEVHDDEITRIFEYSNPLVYARSVDGQ